MAEPAHETGHIGFGCPGELQGLCDIRGEVPTGLGLKGLCGPAEIA